MKKQLLSPLLFHPAVQLTAFGPGSLRQEETGLDPIVPDGNGRTGKIVIRPRAAGQAKPGLAAAGDQFQLVHRHAAVVLPQLIGEGFHPVSDHLGADSKALGQFEQTRQPVRIRTYVRQNRQKNTIGQKQLRRSLIGLPFQRRAFAAIAEKLRVILVK